MSMNHIKAIFWQLRQQAWPDKCRHAKPKPIARTMYMHTIMDFMLNFYSCVLVRVAAEDMDFMPISDLPFSKLLHNLFYAAKGRVVKHADMGNFHFHIGNTIEKCL